MSAIRELPVDSTEARQSAGQPYGDPTELNTCRVILDAVGKEILGGIVGDYLDLLGTSAAVYEKNGDYAYGIFSSGWCRKMDAQSRALCVTPDNREALACGKWHCHESCWSISRESIETNAPADRDCLGGIHIYAMPIRVDDEVLGSINFGYGDPPTDPQKLAELAEKYHLSVDDLRLEAEAYPPRSSFILDVARSRLATAARLIGEIIRRRRAEDRVGKLNTELDRRVRDRTAELEASNKELEGFTYSVAHDLRSPLRAVDAFAHILLNEYLETLPEKSRHYLRLVVDNVRQMGRLIDDLLRFANSGRQSLRVQTVNPGDLVRQCLEELQVEREGRRIEVHLNELPECRADSGLLKQVWFNLLSNALKYTRKRDPAVIEIGSVVGGQEGSGDRGQESEVVYFVKDNGVGFDMQHTGKLFGVFQRLHRAEEYEGSGIGLALAQRIVQRHGGRIWTEAKVDQGAAFYFTLGGRTHA